MDYRMHAPRHTTYIPRYSCTAHLSPGNIKSRGHDISKQEVIKRGQLQDNVFEEVGSLLHFVRWKHIQGYRNN